MDNKKKVNLSRNFKEKIEPRSQFQKKSIPGVKKILAISSAKGGVGKSTICVNLAIAAAKQGFSVGLLDADIYGPSIPDLFNISEKPTADENKKINPIISQNVKLISMGFLIDKNSPMVWRGPMVINAIKSFLNNVNWGQLDCLFVDLPPGTGDAILTFAQELKVDGSIIVTTPQKLSVTDANRGIEMFKKTNIPILGIIENMAYFEDDNKKRHYPFGQLNLDEFAIKKNIKNLGKIEISQSFNLEKENKINFNLHKDKIQKFFFNVIKYLKI